MAQTINISTAGSAAVRQPPSGVDGDRASALRGISGTSSEGDESRQRGARDENEFPRRPLQVGIVDPYPAVALGICAAVNVESGMHAAAVAPTISELLHQTRNVDLVVLGTAFDDSGQAHRGVRALRAAGIPVVLYAWQCEESRRPAWAETDFVGIALKSDPIEGIISQLRRAAQLLRSARIPRDSLSEHAQDAPTLTRREIEVLRLYAAGHTARSVAQCLYVSPHTVIDHIRNIRAKYAAANRRVSSKTELYLRAREDGFIDP